MKYIITDEDKARGYCKYISAGGIIELQLPLDIHNVISKIQLQNWSNNLEKAYYTYYELTNYKPFNKIIVEAYRPCKYLGYVITGSNIIHIDSYFIHQDLAKMTSRKDDWNFCALHEMGHMFDFNRSWTFEAELMTDLKLAYVLEKNNVAATPSEFDVSYNFYGSKIKDAYAVLGQPFSQTYNIFGCVKRFLDIKSKIGWYPFLQTFHEMQRNYNKYSTVSRHRKFINFINLLSQYSGINIRNYFSQNEWNTIVNKTYN